MLSFIRTTTLVIFPVAFLVACNFTPEMAIPEISDVELSESLDPFADQVTFALFKIVANIRRGTSIIHFPGSGMGTGGFLCNYEHSSNSTIDWGPGSSVLGDWSTELGEIFHEALSQKGFSPDYS